MLQERLRLYKKKIHKVESQKWFKEHKRSLEVNVSAANRFISNAIPELTAEQRSALKKVLYHPMYLVLASKAAIACQQCMPKRLWGLV